MTMRPLLSLVLSVAALAAPPGSPSTKAGCSLIKNPDGHTWTIRVVDYWLPIGILKFFPSRPAKGDKPVATLKSYGDSYRVQPYASTYLVVEPSPRTAGTTTAITLGLFPEDSPAKDAKPRQ